MKSRLFSALAIGALAAGMLPGAASAAGLSCSFEAAEDCLAETQMTVTVTEGTTIVVDGLVAIGSAFPGQKVTSAPANIQWWSNEEGMTIFANLDSDPFQDNGVDVGHANNNILDADEISFAAANIELDTSDATYDNAVFGSAALPLQDVVFDGSTTLESASTGTFTLTAHIPQTDEGAYEAWMTYTVADATP